jgi:pilus assembly protein CpaB
MRAKSMALLMLALGCGLVAAIGITQVMAKRNAEPAPVGETQQVLIAVADIPRGERLAPENVKLEPWPKDKVPAGTVSKYDDVDGCRTGTKIYAGEPILEKKLLDKNSSLQGDSALIPKGMRVVSVKVDNVSGGPGLIVPGDRVDVLVHVSRTNQGDIIETSTRTILQDIKVFAVNDVVDMEREKEGATKDKDRLNAKTISLLVTPAQAAKLTLACEVGKVRLVMRGNEAESEAFDGNADLGQLFDKAGKGEREKEALVAPDAIAPTNSLTGMLDSMKNQPKVEPKPAAPITPAETWTIRILQKDGINEVILESDSSPEAAKMPQGPWRINGTNMININGGASVKNAVKTTPVAPAAEPAPVEPPAAEPPDTGAAPPDNNPVRDPAPTPGEGLNRFSEGKE